MAEVWRYTHDHELCVQVLGAGGYETTLFSPTFPELPPTELAAFVQIGIEKGNAAMLRAFRAWLLRG